LVESESEGVHWRLLDRLLFLEALGRLDPRRGDPRLQKEKWVSVEKSDLSFCQWPTTVQEFREFTESRDLMDDTLWSDMPPMILKRRGQLRTAIMKQNRHPNWPVVEVGVGDAIAYCRWRTRARTDAKIVRLPTSSEWQKLMNTRSLRFPWGKASLKNGEDAQVNWSGALIGHPSPVGALEAHPTGLFDLFGNIWEWGIETRVTARAKHRRFAVFGGSFSMNLIHFSGAETPWTNPPADFEVHGESTIGFRTLLTDYDVRISSVDFSRSASIEGEDGNTAEA